MATKSIHGKVCRMSADGSTGQEVTCCHLEAGKSQETGQSAVLLSNPHLVAEIKIKSQSSERNFRMKISRLARLTAKSLIEGIDLSLTPRTQYPDQNLSGKWLIVNPSGDLFSPINEVNALNEWDTSKVGWYRDRYIDLERHLVVKTDNCAAQQFQYKLEGLLEEPKLVRLDPMFRYHRDHGIISKRVNIPLLIDLRVEGPFELKAAGQDVADILNCSIKSFTNGQTQLMFETSSRCMRRVKGLAFDLNHR